jgi:glutaredoxin
MEPEGSRPGRVAVIVVGAPACHFCEDAQAALAELARDYPIEVRRVDAGSAEGAQLLRGHRAPMTPLVLLDGSYVSSGRLPRGKLRKLLDGRRTAGSAR